ncbi:MAG: hypothetical protein WCZ23_03310 [Rhodospirillaceae bacterium]
MTSVSGISSARPFTLPKPVVVVADGVKEAPAKSEPTLLSAWEKTHREMQEKFMSDRLATVEKITSALTPLIVGARTGATARSLAGTLEFLAHETRDIVRTMGRELDRQSTLSDRGEGAVSSRFYDLMEQAGRSLQRTTGMLLAVGGSDETPLPGRKSARDIAADAATPLLSAWDELGSLSLRFGAMNIPRLDIRA